MQEKLKITVLLLLPFIGVFLMETIIRGEIGLTSEWIRQYPKLFLITVGIYLCMQVILIGLLNNVYVAALLTFAFWMLAAVVNYYKVEMMGDPVLPWDFLYANQLFDLLPALYKNVNLLLLGGTAIVALVLFVLLLKYTSFKTFQWKMRIGMIGLAFVPLLLLYNFEKNFTWNMLHDAGAMNISWNQIESQQHNGAMISFLLNIPSIRVEKPEGYSEQAMEELHGEIEQLLLNEEYLTSDIKPNIVVIMSEALWDLKKIDVQENGASLTPTIDANQIGEIVSPRYGGGTSTVEFEALTGFSMANLPGGAVPYQQFMVGETPSLARTLKAHGYETTALHTYYKYFWNRTQAYESLGFDQFIGLEDLQDPAFYGSLYIDDFVITEEIMKTIEQTEAPSFIYATTMQNHGLYNDSRYGEETLQVVDDYSDESNQILNNLATGYKRSDEAYLELLERLEALEEPTLVVMFGDHLPSMSATYEEVGFVEKEQNLTLAEELKMKQTPLAVWNNYGQEFQPVGSVSTSFLPALVMEWAQLPGIGYYSVLQEMLETLPAYTAIVKATSDGQLMQETAEELKEIETMYKTIQYDMMFGEKYSNSFLFELMEYG